MKLFTTSLAVTAVLVTAAVAQAGNPTAAQLRGLEISGRAMNHLCSSSALTAAGYRAVCGSPVSGPTASQLQALEARGQALDNLCVDSTLRPDAYRALCGASTRPTAAELNALEIRGQALNQLCDGNRFASHAAFAAVCGGEAAAQPVRAVPATGFDWGAFGIGVVAAFGAVLLAGGVAAGVHFGRNRSSVRPRPAS